MEVETHLQTQRSAVKMLHERILLLVKYVTDVLAGGSHPPSFRSTAFKIIVI